MEKNTSDNLSGFTPFEYIFNMEDLKFTFVTVQKFGKETYLQKESPKSNEPSPLHFHHFYEIFLCEKGRLEIIFEKEKVQVDEGHMICINPKVNHAANVSVNTVTHNVRFILESNHGKSDFPIYKILKSNLRDSYVCFKTSYETACAVKNLHQMSEGESVPSKYTAMRYIYNFVPLLIADSNNDPTHKILPSSLFSGTRSREYQLDLTINANYCKNITLKFIADSIFLSERQTARLIHQHYGKSFTEVIRSYRMKKAAKLLRETNDAITQISITVGYSSVKGFYNAFKKHFGCLPLEYRKNPPSNL